MLILDLIVSYLVPAAVVVLAILVLAASIRVANQYERGVVFRLGKFNRTAGPGLYLVWPVIEWQIKLDLRTVTRDVEQQEGITRDNVPIKVNAVIWFRIVDPERAVMQVREVANAVVQVSVTTLRTALGQHTLDDILKAQDTISEVMQKSIDNVTEPWGVKVSAAREAGPLDQGRGRTRRRRAAAPGGRGDHAKPGRPGAATNADDHRGRRRTEHDDDHHDAERICRHGARHSRHSGKQIP